MGRAKEIPLDVRRQIIKLRLKGKSYRKIERITGVRNNTCCRIINRVMETSTCKNAPRSGRPLKLSLRDLRALEREITKNPHASLADIVESSGVKIPVRSLQEYLKKSRLYITL